MYGLVFRDKEEESLMFAIFTESGEDFTEIYSIDDHWNDAYDKLTYHEVAFVEVDMSNPTVAGFRYIFDFDCDMSSRDLIVDCYRPEYPDLIKQIYDRCTNPQVLSS